MKKFYLKNCCFLTVLLLLCSYGIRAQIYVDASRPDDSGDGLSLGTAKRTIQAGVNTASASTVIIIAAGTYDELVVIDKPLTIEGVDKNTCTLKYTGGAVSGGTTPTLFKVTAQNVTIKDLSMDVDLAKIWSAIITSGDASGLKILNNKITATRSANTNAASYTDQNAIGANISGRTIPGVTNASNNLGLITVQGTEIAYSLPGIYNVAAFRAGITADNYSLLVGGDNISDGNIIQTINHDVTNRFQTSATQTILKNNTFKGGGIEFSEPNAPFAGAVIVNNTFDYTLGGYPSFALVRFKNNDNNKPFQFKGNTVKNNYWLMSLENFQNIEIDGNTFSPIPNLVNTFKILTVNTKTISSSVNTKLPISAKIVNNKFNGVPLSVNSKALAFYNHDNASPQFGSFVIGETGKPNIFNTDISHYIYLDNDNANLSKDAGNTAMAGYPEYGGNITQTITANWDKNIKADQNQFFVDGQLRVPFDMTLSQRAELDGKIFDKKDDTNIGSAILSSCKKCYYR